MWLEFSATQVPQACFEYVYVSSFLLPALSPSRQKQFLSDLLHWLLTQFYQSPLQFYQFSSKLKPRLTSFYTMKNQIRPLCSLALFWLVGTLSVQATPPVWLPKVMRPGISAFTCTSSGIPATAGTEHVLMFADLRDPVGSPETPIGAGATEWVLTNPRMKADPSWSVAALGEVFGVDVGTGATSDVYLSAMGPKPGNWGGSPWANRNYNTAAGNTGTGGEIFRINGNTYATTLIAALPNHKAFFSDGGSSGLINGNSFVGLGNLSYCEKFNKLYVTNLDDGKIYVVSLATGSFGNVVCTFDHGAQMASPIVDAPTLLYTQRYRMVWGIEYHPQANRLFYALRNGLGLDEVWSLALDASGCPAGAPCLEVTSPVAYGSLADGVYSSVPIDIQFSPDGTRMLVIQCSTVWRPGTVTGVTPAGSFPTNQSFPMRYAHTSRPVEYTRCNPTTTCGGWSLKGTYVSGQGYGGATNCISGDYGYGDLFSTAACDSVVLMSDNIRAFVPSYKYGLQVSPLGDYSRSNLARNFDIPLTAPSGIPGTKIQFNDVDILHVDACMSVCIVPGSVQCPVPANGSGTLQIQITNLTSFPITAVNLTDCGTMPLPSGAVGITPLPIALPGGILNPGATSSPITVTLPNLPPVSSQVCFCVQLIGEGLDGPCEQMVCATFPCAPPCATFTTKDVQCTPGGGYTFSLCVTNGQTIPFSNISFSPSYPLPAGYSTGVPAGPVTLSNPIPNGSMTCIPLGFPTLPATGGPFCFEVTLLGANTFGQVNCRETVTLELPPCEPNCATITTNQVICPTVEGGAYSVTLNIQNLSATQPISQLSFGPCPAYQLPTGAVSVTPANGYVTLASPIPPGGSSQVTISMPGLPCTGVNACFCVTLYTPSSSPLGDTEGFSEICTQMVCVPLPPCTCPPCMTVTATNLRCPTIIGGSYLVDLTLTNSSGTNAANYGLIPSSGSIPVGYTPIQPAPTSVQPLVLNNGSTSLPITVSLPVAPNVGGNYCFDVVLLGANQSTLCKKQVCVILPRCLCANVSVASVNCVNGANQVVLNVANNTQLFGTSYNFTAATFSPSAGFSTATLSPNPILPGTSGTVTFSYSGPAGLKCVNLTLSNASGTRCCTTQVCFDSLSCVSTPVGLCILKDLYPCNSTSTLVTFYINNNTTSPRSFIWSMAPASVPGCTSTLGPAAFTPSSGTTSTIAPGSSVGVTVAVNTTGITPGSCAGFQVCYRPVTRFGIIGTPVCCTSKISCPRMSDPWIEMGSARTLVAPGSIIAIPVTISNTGTEPMVQSLVFTDDSGLLTFHRSRPTDIREPNAEAADTLISNDSPLTISLYEGQTETITIFAQYSDSRIKIGIGTIGVELTPFKAPLDRISTGTIIFGPRVTTTAPSLNKALTDIGMATVDERQAFRCTFRGQPGIGYQILGSTDLVNRYIVAPSIPGSIVEPDGTFYVTDTLSTLSILTLPELKAEFYQFTPTSAVGTAVPVSGGR